MEVQLNYHYTTEVYEVKIADDFYIMEVDRFDPAFHTIKECVEGSIIRLYKMYDKQRIEFENKLFIEEISKFIVSIYPQSLLNNVGRRFPFKYMLDRFISRIFRRKNANN